MSGYSGIGKSSVVNELHKALVPPRGLFASGKFDQYKRDIPYATLAQAFQSLVRPLLGQSEAELGRWRDALSEALGPNGQLIVNLVPELELVIGKQPPVPDLPPQDAQNRFQMVFRRFLGVFARKEHPLALFLDDLQWLDAATLDLLEHLVTHSEVRHLLLVGAYRDNEVGPAHPLLPNARGDPQGRSEGRRRSCWRLSGSTMSAGSSPMPCIASRSARGPWRNWCTRRPAAIRSSRSSSSRRWPKKGCSRSTRSRQPGDGTSMRIRAKSYTDNVVDLMAGKAEAALRHHPGSPETARLPGQRRRDRHPDPGSRETEEAMHAALWEAVRAGLVFRAG